ncbi:MAG: L-threonylcarbamoyladenylate synthase [Burkholderiaceae bacterium]|nr:threonylcarbamoyl-AMP synthase [Rhodoferax sp.]MCW5629588.1 threonylcarbamoyl-AMP synthase [Rhodoferax sp.]
MPVMDGQAAEAIAAAAQALQAGELVGLPTETVYGLAADAGNDAAVAKIFAAKGRPSEHPLIVHVDDAGRGVDGAAVFAQRIPAAAQALMNAFWPGPLTLILPRRAEVGRAAAGGQDSIGLRCPSHPVAQAVLHACRQRGVMGLAAPSANQFGRVSPTTAAHVQREFGPDLLVLDGGACDVGIESTIVDCTRSAPVLLRPGAITPEQLAQACGQPVRLAQDAQDDEPAPRASGTLLAHYAPKAKVRLMNAAALQTALDMLGGDVKPSDAGPVIATYARAVVRSRSSGVLSRRMPDDAASTARQLFAVLRDFDDQGVKLIWVEEPPEGAAWDGVRDRLQRASAAG